MTEPGDIRPNPLIAQNNAYEDGYSDAVRDCIAALRKKRKMVSAAILDYEMSDKAEIHIAPNGALEINRIDRPESPQTPCTLTEPTKLSRVGRKPRPDKKTRQKSKESKPRSPK
jgi:hypothetical protein